MSKDSKQKKQKIEFEFIVFIFATVGFVLLGSTKIIPDILELFFSFLNGKTQINGIFNIIKLFLGFIASVMIFAIAIYHTVIGYKLLRKYAEQSKEPLYKDFVNSLIFVIVIIVLLVIYGYQ